MLIFFTYQAVIACVSPKYVVSSHCVKELSLADLLRKPIIPVMIDKTVWPPPGGMALIFSQLVYINMKGNILSLASTIIFTVYVLTFMIFSVPSFEVSILEFCNEILKIMFSQNFLQITSGWI